MVRLNGPKADGLSVSKPPLQKPNRGADNVPHEVRIQSVVATHALNLAAGVS